MVDQVKIVGRRAEESLKCSDREEEREREKREGERERERVVGEERLRLI